MDVVRPHANRRRWVRRAILGTVLLLLAAGATLGLSRLKPADPAIERSLMVVDTVKRGLMLREVRGSGTFVSEEAYWVAAATDGLVVNVPLQAGVEVHPDTALVELSNADLALSATKAEWTAKAAAAQLVSQRAKQQDEILEMQAAIVAQKAEYNQAVMQKQVDEQLLSDGLVSKRQFTLDSAKVENLAALVEIGQKRLERKVQSQDAELAVLQAAVEQANADHELKKKLVSGLSVRAGINGVLEQVKAEVGQRIVAGTVLARVINPRKLKASLKIPETQARDVILGQKATIDTRNTLIPGHVVRINPASESGSVTVDVALDGPLPREARPDLNIDGVIELERLENVLYVGRPVYCQPEATAMLFKLEGPGSAVRTRAKLGRSSVNTIEVLDGLEVGDQVIISDTKQWDAYDRLRVH